MYSLGAARTQVQPRVCTMTQKGLERYVTPNATTGALRNHISRITLGGFTNCILRNYKLPLIPSLGDIHEGFSAQPSCCSHARGEEDGGWMGGGEWGKGWVDGWR
jgi:hypothetical protein